MQSWWDFWRSPFLRSYSPSLPTSGPRQSTAHTTLQRRGCHLVPQLWGLHSSFTVCGPCKGVGDVREMELIAVYLETSSCVPHNHIMNSIMMKCPLRQTSVGRNTASQTTYPSLGLTSVACYYKQTLQKVTTVGQPS